MQDKGFEGIYIGYDISSESHKIINISTGKIIFTINVKIENKTNSKKITLNKKKAVTTDEKIVNDDVTQ